MPEISVIVPVYKVEKYLADCVQSLMEQTFQDIEIILVDDGSPDRCGVLCDKLAEKDSRIRVIHQSNQGLSCARNSGVKAAIGRYICFVDSDDLVAPDYCQVLLELLEKTDYDFSFCGVHRFPDGTTPVPEDHAGTAVVSNIEYLKMQFDCRTEFGVWNKLFRRDLFKHIRFMPGKLNEDVIYSADLARNLQNGAVYTNRQLYLYRQREGGIVATQSHRCSPDRIFAGEYLLNVLKETCPELTDQALRYAVEYPWMYVDPIYVRRTFRINKAFLDTIQKYLKDHLTEYQDRKIFSNVQTRQMQLFSKSKICYACNAYARLARVYLYRLIGRDAYRDGHGI